MPLQQDPKKYHRIKNCFFYFGIVFDVLLLLILQFSGLSILFRDFASSLSSLSLVTNAIYITFFCTVFYVMHFPMNYFLGFVWEHRFGLSTQNLRQWLADDLKKALLSFLFAIILVAVIYEFLGRFPQTWWIGAGCVWLFLSLFLARIMPNFIIPLFYKYSKVDSEELRERILNLFQECGVAIQDVYAIDFSSKTKKANAMVCGLGRKRRVILTDTLLATFSHEEIEAVLAHELGHYKRRDILKLIMVNTVAIFIGFYLVDHFLRWVLSSLDLGLWGMHDIAALPVFAIGMMLFGFITTPLLNAFSRFLEVQADMFSLRMTGKPEEFISMMTKLGEMNLAEMEPSWINEMMFYDHPPIPKRVRLAQRFRESNA